MTPWAGAIGGASRAVRTDRRGAAVVRGEGWAGVSLVPWRPGVARKFQFGAAFLPTINQGEPAVIYCFLFLFLACKGSGCCSLGGGSRPSA